MMWRWVIGFMLLGLMELLLVIQLHQWFSVKNMLLIYIVTTVVGFLFLFLIKRQVFKGHRISKKAHQRLRQKLSKKSVLLGDEKQQFKIEMMLLFYLIAWILIVIPGLLTDVMGMLLVLPGLMNWLVDKAIINYDQESVSFSKNKQ